MLILPRSRAELRARLPNKRSDRMRGLVVIGVLSVVLSSSAAALAAEALTKPAKISLDESGVLVIDGKKIFPINLTVVPGPDAKAPDGRNAYEAFADDGAVFMRSGKPDW